VCELNKPKDLKHSNLVREQPFTYEDYAKLPDDGIRYELADGLLEVMSPSSNAVHQLMIQQLMEVLNRSCSQEYVIFLAPMDVILSETEVRQPDIIMLHRERLSLVTKRGIEGAPDLVAEVLSPHSIKRDRHGKLQSYAKYRIPEYWIVDVNNVALEQYLLNGDRYELVEVYAGDDHVRSELLRCVSFSMNNLIASLPELPNF
jgi:Uma2 family endonuclease